MVCCGDCGLQENWRKIGWWLKLGGSVFVAASSGQSSEAMPEAGGSRFFSGCGSRTRLELVTVPALPARN
jgi:hypothetical protein